MTQEKMDRISELTRIARERDLTPEEQAERKALREEYIADWRRSTIDSARKHVHRPRRRPHHETAEEKALSRHALDKRGISCYTRRGISLKKGEINRKESEQCVFAAAAASGSRHVRRPVVVVRKEASLSAGKSTAAPKRYVRHASTWSCSAGSERFLRFFACGAM